MSGRMYQGRALSARAYARFVMLNACELEHVALADLVQAQLMGDPERIDMARRIWLRCEQRVRRGRRRVVHGRSDREAHAALAGR